MMRVSDLQLLFDYNYWARDRLLKAAAGISQEQFLAPAGYPHGGVRGTLGHGLGAEWIWRNRWQGTSPERMPRADDFPTLEALAARWREEEQAMRAYLAGLSDKDIQGEIEYRTTSGQDNRQVLWQLMVHLVNHGTQHRSEVAQLLTDFGHSPGDIDLVLFLRERAARS